MRSWRALEAPGGPCPREVRCYLSQCQRMWPIFLPHLHETRSRFLSAEHTRWLEAAQARPQRQQQQQGLW